MYRIVLACKGVPATVGAVAARDIPRSSPTGRGTRMFGVSGMGLDLMLQAENDFDSNGLALLDEFSGRFQLPSRMASTAVSKLLLLANCRRIPPRTDPLSAMGMFHQQPLKSKSTSARLVGVDEADLSSRPNADPPLFRNSGKRGHHENSNLRNW